MSDVHNTSPSPPVQSPRSKPARQPVTYDLSELQPWREYAVTLHNDEHHSMEEVVGQLIKALECSSVRAYSIMMEAHTKGKAVVVITNREKALRIQSVLQQIELMVTLRQVN